MKIVTNETECSDYLRSLRGRRSCAGFVSGKDVADKIGLTSTTLYNIENEPYKCTLDRLQALANVHGLKIRLMFEDF